VAELRLPFTLTLVARVSQVHERPVQLATFRTGSDTFLFCQCRLHCNYFLSYKKASFRFLNGRTLTRAYLQFGYQGSRFRPVPSLAHTETAGET
jgi:hypothetical protein